jgi:hypothetical protein
LFGVVLRDFPYSSCSNNSIIKPPILAVHQSVDQKSLVRLLEQNGKEATLGEHLQAVNYAIAI